MLVSLIRHRFTQGRIPLDQAHWTMPFYTKGTTMPFHQSSKTDSKITSIPRVPDSSTSKSTVDGSTSTRSGPRRRRRRLWVSSVFLPNWSLSLSLSLSLLLFHNCHGWICYDFCVFIHLIKMGFSFLVSNPFMLSKFRFFFFWVKNISLYLLHVWQNASESWVCYMFCNV